MRTEDEESSSRKPSGEDRPSRKKKRSVHIHIGPNVRAFRVGLAFCPVCDAEKGLRITEKEKEAEKDRHYAEKFKQKTY